MIEFFLGLVTELTSVPRRWDGKNLSPNGTVRSAFRTLSGSQPGVTRRWSTYRTTISDRHLWVGPNSVPVRSVRLSARRSPSKGERWSLDRDFIVVPVSVSNGDEIEWALRASALYQAVQLLGPVTVE